MFYISTKTEKGVLIIFLDAIASLHLIMSVSHYRYNFIRPRQFGSGACETLFKPPHNYFHQCSGEKIHYPHVCHLTFRILNMRFKCFSANFSCLIVRFSAKSLSTSYACFVYGLHSALTPRLSRLPRPLRVPSLQWPSHEPGLWPLTTSLSPTHPPPPSP